MIPALIIATALLALALLLLRVIRGRHRALQARNRARAEADRIAHLAYQDELTGLPNARTAELAIDKAIARSARMRRMVAVHFLDIDRFKAINDAHGHTVGDAVLVEVARRLEKCVREEDTVARALSHEEIDGRIARLHGDEFMVIQYMVRGRTDAEHLKVRLADCMRDPIEIAGTALRVTLSSGYALAPSEGVTAADLRRNADLAMYRAKRGRNGGMGAAA